MKIQLKILVTLAALIAGLVSAPTVYAEETKKSSESMMGQGGMMQGGKMQGGKMQGSKEGQMGQGGMMGMMSMMGQMSQMMKTCNTMMTGMMPHQKENLEQPGKSPKDKG